MKVIILSIVLQLICGSLFAQDTPRKAASKGIEYYNKEEFDKSAAEFITGLRANPSDMEKEQLNFDLGTAQYKSGNFEEAAGWFSRSAESALEKNPEFASKALYNLGNSYVQLQKLEEAANAYKYALKLDHQDLEAKENLETVLKMMQMQPQQQQQQQQDQQQEEQPDSTDQQQQQSQQTQPDSSGNQEQQPQPEPTDMSEEEALDLLKALEGDEQEAQKDKLERQFGKPQRKGKDW